MARIRSVHPGLLTDEAFMCLTVEQPLANTLYIGLLMESDDAGIFEWKPMTLKARILPAVNMDMAPILTCLKNHKFVTDYELDGRYLGAVRNFCRYQRPKKPHYTLPRTPEIEEWVSFKDRKFGTGGEPVLHRSETGSPKSPQMKEEGGSKNPSQKAKSQDTTVQDDPLGARPSSTPARENGSSATQDLESDPFAERGVIHA